MLALTTMSRLSLMSRLTCAAAFGASLYLSMRNSPKNKANILSMQSTHAEDKVIVANEVDTSTAPQKDRFDLPIGWNGCCYNYEVKEAYLKKPGEILEVPYTDDHYGWCCICNDDSIRISASYKCNTCSRKNKKGQLNHGGVKGYRHLKDLEEIAGQTLAWGKEKTCSNWMNANPDMHSNLTKGTSAGDPLSPCGNMCKTYLQSCSSNPMDRCYEGPRYKQKSFAATDEIQQALAKGADAIEKSSDSLDDELKKTLSHSLKSKHVQSEIEATAADAFGMKVDSEEIAQEISSIKSLVSKGDSPEGNDQISEGVLFDIAQESVEEMAETAAELQELQSVEEEAKGESRVVRSEIKSEIASVSKLRIDSQNQENSLESQLMASEVRIGVDSEEELHEDLIEQKQDIESEFQDLTDLYDSEKKSGASPSIQTETKEVLGDVDTEIKAWKTALADESKVLESESRGGSASQVETIDNLEKQLIKSLSTAFVSEEVVADEIGALSSDLDGVQSTPASVSHLASTLVTEAELDVSSGGHVDTEAVLRHEQDITFSASEIGGKSHTSSERYAEDASEITHGQQDLEMHALGVENAEDAEKKTPC